MEDRKLDAAESLALIGKMIENTRNRMERNAGRPFLIWGYTTIVVTAAVWFTLAQTQCYQWHYLWFALPLIGWVLMWLTHRPTNDKGKGEVRTFVDRVVNQIWLIVGGSAVFVSTLSIFAVIHPPIVFTMLLMMGIGATLTGAVIQFRPATAGGIAGILLAAGSLYTSCSDALYLIMIVGFIAMMIVPGHILNYRSNHPKAQ